MAFGDDTGKLRRRVLIVMAFVLLTLGYIGLRPVLTQKPAPVVQTEAGLPASVPMPSASPTQSSKDKKAALVAMVGPLTGKPIEDNPIAP